MLSTNVGLWREVNRTWFCAVDTPILSEENKRQDGGSIFTLEQAV